MKVLTVTGLSGSGKTTTLEHIIKELKKRGHSVGTVKEIHFEAFTMDSEGKNTHRHRMAGADTVTARGINETDVLYKGHLSIWDILAHYTEDYVLLEGVRDAIVPEIVVCAEDAVPELSSLTFAISGRYANTHSGSYKGIPIINATDNISGLTDLIEKKVPPLFYDFDKECCGICGMECREFLSAFLRGKRSLDECVLQAHQKVKLLVNGRDVPLVPFVKNILKNAVIGVASELKGYKENAKIEIIIDNG